MILRPRRRSRGLAACLACAVDRRLLRSCSILDRVFVVIIGKGYRLVELG